MINQQAILRLRETNLSGETLLNIFLTLAEALAQQPAEQIAWTVGYVKDDELQTGDLVPIINLVLTRHMPEELKENDSTGVSTT